MLIKSNSFINSALFFFTSLLGVAPVVWCAVGSSTDSVKIKELDLQAFEKKLIEDFPLIKNAIIEIDLATQKRLEASSALDLNMKGKFDRRYGPYETTRSEFLLNQKTTFYGLGFQTGWRRGQGVFPSYEEYETTPTGELFLRAELPILQGGWIDKIRQGIQSAEIEIENSRNMYRIQSLLIRSEALKLYWDWVSFAAIRIELEDLLEKIKSRQSWIERKAKAGLLPELKIAENLKGQYMVEQTWTENENQFEMMKQNIKFYFFPNQETESEITLPKDSAQKVISPPRSIEWNEDPDWIDRHPYVAKVNFKIEQERLKQRLANNQLFPKLDLYFEQVAPIGGTKPTLAENESKVGVNFSIPLQRSEARARYRIANQKLSILENLRRVTQNELLRDHKNYLQNLTRLEEQLVLMRKQVDINRRLRDAEETFFRRGRSSLLNVNLRERTLLNSEIKWIQMRAKFEKLKIAFRAFHARPILATDELIKDK